MFTKIIDRLLKRVLIGNKEEQYLFYKELDAIKKWSDRIHKHNGIILTKGRRIPKPFFKNKQDEKNYYSELRREFENKHGDAIKRMIRK